MSEAKWDWPLDLKRMAFTLVQVKPLENTMSIRISRIYLILFEVLLVLSAFLLLVIACTAFGAWKGYDYSLNCTRCLKSKHVIEQQFFGVTFSRTSKDMDLSADYERIFGHPCEHIFRKGGFGRTSHSLSRSIVGCGLTGDGSLLRPRLEAVSAVYDAEHLFHDRDLTLDTFRLIDTLMPPDIRMEQRNDLTRAAQSNLFLFGSSLRDVGTAQQWQRVLDAAKKDFRDTSNRLREETQPAMLKVLMPEPDLGKGKQAKE